MLPDSKKPWLSKTIWVNLILAVAPFIPGASDLVQAHMVEFTMLWGVLNVVLRLITKDKISLSE